MNIPVEHNDVAEPRAHAARNETEAAGTESESVIQSGGALWYRRAAARCYYVLFNDSDAFYIPNNITI